MIEITKNIGILWSLLEEFNCYISVIKVFMVKMGHIYLNNLFIFIGNLFDFYKNSLILVIFRNYNNNNRNNNSIL